MKKIVYVMTSSVCLLVLAGCNNSHDKSSDTSDKAKTSVVKKAKSSTSSKKQTSVKESDQKFKYSLVGTWTSEDTKMTYRDDGTLKQVSSASGMTNKGTYSIVSEGPDWVKVKQTIHVSKKSSNDQTVTLKFKDKSHYNDGMIDWKLGE